MKYKEIEGIDKPLSIFTFGTTGPASAGRKEEAFRIYDDAWEVGFRTFDTAHSYGAGEETLGEWLYRSGHRNEAVILDKGCNPGQKGSDDVFSARTIRDQVEESLKRLKTDYVELYILHRDDAAVPVDEIIEELNRLRKEGKILRFGGSNWTFERILAANQYAAEHNLTGFTVVSPAFSLADYIHDPWGGSVSLAGEQQAPYRLWLAKTDTPVFCYSSLGRGYLSGKFRTDGSKPIEECILEAPIMEYDAPVNRARLHRAELMAAEKSTTVTSICLAWLLHQQMNLFPIIAPSTSEHMNENIEALDIMLSEQESEWLLSGEQT